MRVLGIDPGLASCGFALLEAPRPGPFEVRVVDAGCWTSDADATIVVRLGELVRDIDDYLRRTEPKAVVVEIPSFPRSAVAAHMLGLAYGAITGLCAGRALLVERRPQQWRKLLGLATKRDGDDPDAAHRARKKATAEAMRARFPGLDALLASCPGVRREHAIDAVAIGCSWVDHAGGTPAQTEA